MTPAEIAERKSKAHSMIVVIRELLRREQLEYAQRLLVVVDGKFNELIAAGEKIDESLQVDFAEVGKGIIALSEQQCVDNIRADAAAAQQCATDESEKAEIEADAQEQIALAKAASADAQMYIDDGGSGAAAPIPQVVAPAQQAIAPGLQMAGPAGPEPQAQMAEVELRPVAAEPQQRDYGAYQNASDDQQGYVALGGDEKPVCPCVIL